MSIEKVEQHGWPYGHIGCHADLIFADPPYNIGMDYANDPTGDDHLDYDWLIENTINSLVAHSRSDAWLWWMCPSDHGDWITPHLRQFGTIVHRIIWYETFAQYNPRSFTKDWRFIFGVRRGNPPFNPGTIRIRSRRNELGDLRGDPRGRVPGSVWTIRRLQGTSLDRVDWHPAQLPPELLDRIVRSCTNAGHLVLDAFGGSGNMGLVCRKLGRSFVLVDQSPTYVTKMKERLGL